jgi:hypothetical protein
MGHEEETCHVSGKKPVKQSIPRYVIEFELYEDHSGVWLENRSGESQTGDKGTVKKLFQQS